MRSSSSSRKEETYSVGGEVGGGALGAGAELVEENNSVGAGSSKLS